jgi:2-polyprenyl-6-methoxyphenol hydroxylase-like FAD-dependent oxidoreductase
LNIAIVGGGIGGVATAVALRQRGIETALYERAPEIREVGAGMMVWPNAARVLRELGVLDHLISLSGRNTNFLVRARNGRVLMNIPLGEFDVPALCTRRSDLLAVLLAKIPSESIRLGHELSRLDQRESSVRLHFANGDCAEHTAVIGADGIRSRTRAGLFGTIEPVDRGYTVWRGIAKYAGAAIEAGFNSETWGRGQRFGILNTGHDRVTWYAASRQRNCNLLQAFDGWHDPIPELIRSTETILCNRALDLAPLPHWSRGAVTLLGDAAHPCTPNLGQGCCMAIEDAMVLAKSVHASHSISAAFTHYETVRRPRTSHIQSRSRTMGWLGQWENRALTAGRDIVTQMLPAKIFERNLRRVYSYET